MRQIGADCIRSWPFSFQNARSPWWIYGAYSLRSIRHYARPEYDKSIPQSQERTSGACKAHHSRKSHHGQTGWLSVTQTDDGQRCYSHPAQRFVVLCAAGLRHSHYRLLVRPQHLRGLLEYLYRESDETHAEGEREFLECTAHLEGRGPETE